jgi:hypothetical protein
MLHVLKPGAKEAQGGLGVFGPRQSDFKIVLAEIAAARQRRAERSRSRCVVRRLYFTGSAMSSVCEKKT